MEATNLGCCKLSWGSVISKNVNLTSQKRMVRRRCESGDGWGRLVDEGMIVLRWRIKEMKRMEEANQEVPSHWMEWEKQYYAHYYDQHVFHAMELLQSYLMSLRLRPSVALGVLVLVSLSVLMCSGVGFFHALEVANSLVSYFYSSRELI
ncbi:hypothetical protein AAZX31_18G273300 [Glycine max]|uniref:Uncharacterized protein n=1 Tax=Glycine soja TaxID=3848 RepID=A0A445FZJ6_GLYSO|nr:hypothetical protein JHK86_051757 [Glycine max]KAG4937694.1 hypothetical protein JHK85_052613 [Glycine max]KAH1156679.1 hypothetical protein GYH30_051467 [Glycine max]KHN13916.1 hypothetical protein glysoja_016200 [Glycine soja]RZB54236.1 hypothetical protein D0Y65_049921 [Glycine soja]